MVGTRFSTASNRAARVGQRELAIVGGAERADPRVEHLHRVHSRLDLRDEVIRHDRRQLLAEAMPGVGMPVHQRLGLGERVRVSAFDRVRRQRERRAGKADERHPAAQLRLDLPDGRAARAPAPREARTRAARSMSAGSLIGRSSCGPSPLMKSKGSPIGSSGRSRSENRMAASRSTRRTGCSVTSVARSGVRQMSSRE